MGYSRDYQSYLEGCLINDMGYEELYNELSIVLSADVMCETLEQVAQNWDYKLDCMDED